VLNSLWPWKSVNVQRWVGIVKLGNRRGRSIVRASASYLKILRATAHFDMFWIEIDTLQSPMQDEAKLGLALR
jgi:hypothetical protein